jgi:hypothetical protein
MILVPSKRSVVAKTALNQSTFWANSLENRTGNPKALIRETTSLIGSKNRVRLVLLYVVRTLRFWLIVLRKN